MIFATRQLVKKFPEHNDIEKKANDSVPRSALWSVLEQYGLQYSPLLNHFTVVCRQW